MGHRPGIGRTEARPGGTNWLRDKMGPGRAIPLADIYRNGPAAIRSAGTARRVMQLLTHHGWVVAAEHPTAREAFELVTV